MPHQSKPAAHRESFRSDPMRDEVYRQMFRLEEGRPGAEVQLAVAMLRAWSALEKLPCEDEKRQWLRRICPICIKMIESMSASGSDQQRSECGGKLSVRHKGEDHGS
jgi:hypothetical protein